MRLPRPLLLSALAAIVLPIGAATISSAHSTGATSTPAPRGSPSREITQPRSPAPPPSDLTPVASSHHAEPPREVVKAREQAQDDRGTPEAR